MGRRVGNFFLLFSKFFFESDSLLPSHHRSDLTFFKIITKIPRSTKKRKRKKTSPYLFVLHVLNLLEEENKLLLLPIHHDRDVISMRGLEIEFGSDPSLDPTKKEDGKC